MLMRYLLISVFLILTSGCVANKDGIYQGFANSGKIDYYNAAEIRQRHLDSLNAIRQEKGLEEETS